MAYCDYNFYKNTYYGNAIKESDFARLADRASDKLDQLTFDRLTGGLPTDAALVKKIKKATCKLAETINNFEMAEASAGYIQNSDGTLKGRVISSITVGSESMSFANGNNAYSNVLLEPGVRERLCYDAAREYLSGTGLLYAGV